MTLIGGCSSTDTESEPDSLNEKSKSEQTKTTNGAVEAINRADRDIDAETVVRNYRIGVTLEPSTTIYRGDEVVSRSSSERRQLRVVLRETRSKRKLPGSNVHVMFFDSNDQQIQRVELLETWGDYLFYGRNLRIPENTSTVTVSVTPPLVGRHEDMKELYVEPVNANFELVSGNGTRTFDGSLVETLPDDVEPGADVRLARSEFLDEQTSGPYRIGFIAEHSEPYWLFSKEEDGNKSPYSLKMADIPQSANRHLEIVLLEKSTNRIIPHADVKLDVRAKDKKAQASVNLHFLLSAFNHYGNSLYLPDGKYTVESTINSPDLHTLEKGKFSTSRTVTFDWNPKEEHGEHEEHDDH